jgi:hypothetical protein
LYVLAFSSFLALHSNTTLTHSRTHALTHDSLTHALTHSRTHALHSHTLALPLTHIAQSSVLRAENSQLKLEVWDADIASPPDFIGQRTIPTSSLSLFFPQIHVLPLSPREDKIGKFMKRSRDDEKLGSLRVKTQYLIRKSPDRCSAPDLLKNPEDAAEMFKVLVRMLVTERYGFF